MSARDRVRRCGVALLGWLALASVAHAGPPERFVQLAFHPQNPDVLALRYENGGDGAFFSHDGGKTWQLLCASAIDPALIATFTLGVTKAGEVLFSGQGNAGDDTFPKTLWQDDGHGCSFDAVAGLEDTGIHEIAADPSGGDALYAVTYGFDPGTKNGLMRRDAKGAWQRVGPQDAALSFEGLRLLATADGVRIYTTALRMSGDADAGTLAYGPVLRFSDDRGEHWTEHPIEPPTPRTAMELEAIDPLDPDTIVLSARRPDSQGIPWMDSSDTILISHDRGETFASVLTISEFGGAVFTPDGRLWIGDGGNVNDSKSPNGLWVAKDSKSKLERVGDTRVTCLAYQPLSDTLYACQTFSIGRIHVDDGSYEELMRTTEATYFVHCENVNVPAACETQLCGAYCGSGHFAQAPLCRVYTGPYCGPAVAISEGTLEPSGGRGDAGRSDAGAADAATRGTTGHHSDAGAAVAPHVRGRDCGCSTVRADPAPRAVAGLLVGAILLGLRRRAAR